MPDPKSLVAIVDDDAAFRTSVARLLRSVGLNTRLFASVAEYLESEPPDCPTCLILDVRMPGQSGLDFQRDLEKMRRAAKAVSYPAAHIGAITDDGFGTPEGVPVTYVIDVDGVVRDKFIATPNKLLHDVVLPLLPH